MARQIAYVALAASPSELANVALDQIPNDVRDEVEEMYKALKTSPNGRFSATFDTVEERAQYESQVVSYCRQRPAGAIRYRKSPVRGAADTELHFRISDLKVADATKAPEGVPSGGAVKAAGAKRGK